MKQKDTGGIPMNHVGVPLSVLRHVDVARSYSDKFKAVYDHKIQMADKHYE